MQRDAAIRGPHRLSLSRTWGRGRRIGWVMLNPSTADHRRDDPTIRRCIGFAQAWGYAGLTVANLFTRITPSPRTLLSHPRPNHPDADRELRAILDNHDTLVAAWGAAADDPAVARRAQQLLQLAEEAGRTLRCLGHTRGGHPRHPLYVPRSQPLIDWNPDGQDTNLPTLPRIADSSTLPPSTSLHPLIRMNG